MTLPLVCLNMIVRNNEDTIESCLESVLPIINTFCIFDRGSHDNTVNIITKFFRKNKIEGKIFSVSDSEMVSKAMSRESRGLSKYIFPMNPKHILMINHLDNLNTLIDNCDYVKIIFLQDDITQPLVRFFKNNDASYIIIGTNYIPVERFGKKIRTLTQETMYLIPHNLMQNNLTKCSSKN